ncbi:hypothetical protein C349_04399 [Cryptococcus neoformans var. grubii Br795]|nr:hypothetical protein C353_04368 [Cryptococcus neoformans var. grubii AD1-83a]OWZ52976.1 hypothetical protein C368_04541 [Cryptococcus neoformans var. grubii 125.91]OXG48231.1 hypothetical protein C355_04174 [Cryptococcus neoformans var. grubii Th84]OXG55695.1 hypothetical protein C354_04302 [Cryptococcus neoformans var. grubii MW-RSA1955]OXG77548.1 hypothetical protein C350_04252 [Cryptococcus neoformans var. grubii MW-RSA36]OXG79450.1 hypothetical protein C349_04399 [Cryptococcus neoforman
MPFLQRLAFPRYSTYRVGSFLSPKDENFWKVAAKEIFELGELGEKERREVFQFVFREDGTCFGAAKKGGRAEEMGMRVGEDVDQGRNVDLAREREWGEKSRDEDDGGYSVTLGLDDEEKDGAGLLDS